MLLCPLTSITCCKTRQHVITTSRPRQTSARAASTGNINHQWQTVANEASLTDDDVLSKEEEEHTKQNQSRVADVRGMLQQQANWRRGVKDAQDARHQTCMHWHGMQQHITQHVANLE